MNSVTKSVADEIEYEFFPFLRIFKSGRLQRLVESPFLPASFDPSTSVVSKDITIQTQHHHHPLTLRLYLPSNPNNKLPILLYFHGGCFCIETPFSPTYHPYLNSLVSATNFIAVSVHYRRLPHHPLPAAYLDSFSAFSYLFSPSADPWIRHFADLNRLYIAGDSAGSNIAHHVAVRAASEGTAIKGLAMIHPSFWKKGNVRGIERLWRIIEPEWKEGLVEEGLVVVAPTWREVGPEVGALRRVGKVAVSVAGMDPFRGVGVEYGEKLKEEGVVVEMWVTEGEDHVFHLKDPRTEMAMVEMDRMVKFLTNE